MIIGLIKVSTRKKNYQEINPFRLAELEAKLEGKGSSMSNGVSGGKSATEKVKEQGDLVRQLKADKASKEVGQCLTLSKLTPHSNNRR